MTTQLRQESGFLKINYYYFLLHWVFIATGGLSLVATSGAYPSLRYTAFSLPWLLLLHITGSGHVGLGSCSVWALECRLSSRGVRA